MYLEHLAHSAWHIEELTEGQHSSAEKNLRKLDARVLQRESLSFKVIVTPNS